MTDTKIRLCDPSHDRPYFVHDPLGDGFTYFATEQERDDHAHDVIQAYLDDCWDEEVTNVTGGMITHQSTQVDREDRPDTVNEEGICGEGGYWPDDVEYKCNYELKPISQ